MPAKITLSLPPLIDAEQRHDLKIWLEQYKAVLSIDQVARFRLIWSITDAHFVQRHIAHKRRVSLADLERATGEKGPRIKSTFSDYLELGLTRAIFHEKSVITLRENYVSDAHRAQAEHRQARKIAGQEEAEAALRVIEIAHSNIGRTSPSVTVFMTQNMRDQFMAFGGPQWLRDTLKKEAQ